MKDILLMEKQGHICTLTLNRPESNNGLTLPLFARLDEALNTINKDKEIRVVILRGSGEKVFSTGIDLADDVKRGNTLEEVRKDKDRYKEASLRVTEEIISCRCPVIAMIYGDALGCACYLASSCDLRVASEISHFSLHTVLVGEVFQYQAIQRAINLIGVGYASELLMTGRKIDALKAKEWGLINYVVPSTNVYSTTMSLAQDIAEKAPLAVSGTKATIAQIFKYQQTPSSKVKTDFQAFMDVCLHSEDALEGPKAFLEGRKPNFMGK